MIAHPPPPSQAIQNKFSSSAEMFSASIKENLYFVESLKLNENCSIYDL